MKKLILFLLLIVGFNANAFNQSILEVDTPSINVCAMPKKITGNLHDKLIVEDSSCFHGTKKMDLIDFISVYISPYISSFQTDSVHVGVNQIGYGNTSTGLLTSDNKFTRTAKTTTIKNGTLDYSRITNDSTHWELLHNTKSGKIIDMLGDSNGVSIYNMGENGIQINDASGTGLSLLTPTDTLSIGGGIGYVSNQTLLTLNAPIISIPYLANSTAVGVDNLGRLYDNSGGGGGVGWSLTGNALTGYNQIGTTNKRSFPIVTNDTARIVVDSLGNVSIGGSYSCFSSGSTSFFQVILPYTQADFPPGSVQAFIFAPDSDFYMGVGAGGNPASTYCGSSENLAIGYNAMGRSSGVSNVECLAIGKNALANNQQMSNLAIGSQSLTTNTLGSDNLAVGEHTLRYSRFGDGNSAVGQFSLLNSGSAGTGGNYNCTLGAFSMVQSIDASKNISIGYLSLDSLQNGQGNIAIGHKALYKNINDIDTNIIAIGYMADVLKAHLKNAVTIGANSRVGCSNCGVLGDTTTTQQWGIGYSTPSAILGANAGLAVNGDLNVSGTIFNPTTPTISSGVVAPVSTPSRIGNIFIDTVLGKVYVSVGTGSSADWKILN